MPTSAAVMEGALEFHSSAKQLVNVMERELCEGSLSGIESRDLERVITAAVKLYAAKAETESNFAAPVSKEGVTPTQVLLIVTEMLRAVDLGLFDLAMWYRRPR